MALQFMPTVKLLQLQPKTVKVTREFAVLAARMIPLPGKGDPISLDLLANVELGMGQPHPCIILCLLLSYNVCPGTPTY